MEAVRSVCPYCGVGCGIVMQVGADGRVAKVEGDKDHPANRGRLCTKGQTCALPLTASGRMDAAYLRRERQREPVRVEMDAAIAETARRLKALIDRDGPDAVALYVSGQMSLEAQYLANKLAKGYIGTHQIESNSRLCMASAGTGYKLSLGADAPPGAYTDFDQADLFLVSGANMADTHPVLFLRMMDRVKAGAKLIVVDPRRTATADKAHLHLPIRPGSDLALLNGLLHLLHAHGHTDADFIARHTEGWDALPDLLADYTPDRVAALTGLPEAELRQAAQWIGEAEAWMSCWTMGLNQSTHGTWNTNAICNLHLATGAICRPGAGPFSLTGQPNAMGGREMGYMGPGLPGQRSALDPEDRAFVEQVWGLPAGRLPARAGDGTVGLFERMAAGEVKACWIICTNPVASVANRSKVIEALQRAELVITQDAFLDTETNRLADILLPGALWAEAEGVMVNSERNLTLMPRAVAPPGQALPDWQIIARVACAMGYAEGFSYESAEEVFDEIRQFHNPSTGYDLRGIDHARLRQGPVQWPCAPGDTADRHPIRYRLDANAPMLKGRAPGPALRFPTPSGKARFHARPHREPAEGPDADYPLVLNTGRVQHQWHTMTKTGRVPMLNKLNPGPYVEIHPDDAQALGATQRDRVELCSRRGRVVLPAQITERVQPGQCFVPIHWNDVFGDELAVNALTSDAVDPLSQQPEFKQCAVRLRRVSGPAESDRDPADAEEATAPTEAGPRGTLTLLWASQTGRAEEIAGLCARRLRADGWGVRLLGMDRCRIEDLPTGQPLLMVASTFGDGDPPDGAVDFWRALQTEAATPLAATPYAVLALGDSSYAQFCGFGRRLDARLEALGARRLTPRLDCEPDFQASASAWLAAVRRALAPTEAEVGARLVHSQASALAEPDLDEDPFRVTLGASSGAAASPSRTHPLRTRLRYQRRLSAAGSAKDVRQYAIELPDPVLSYRAGDALGVWPTNCPEEVAEMLSALHLSPTAPVQLAGLGEMPLADALLRHLEIGRVSPDVLGFVQTHAGRPDLTERLRPEHAQALQTWLWGQRIVDLLRAHPIRVSAQAWVEALKRLQPRLYSISSSPEVHPDEVHLTVSAVRWQHEGRARRGVCSTFLADRSDGAELPIFVQPTAHFRPPADGSRPMIMVGPGTGVAPFRGFLQQRRACGDTGRNWLFFGEQHAATDFYYCEEFEALQRDGLLTRLSLAFSRDQAQRIYVQDRMREQGAQLWAWLQEGASFYVCGDASRMARDVETALKDVVQTQGGLTAEEAEAYVAGLARDRRYLRDVY